MTQIPISRRAWLLAAAAGYGCGRKKAPRMSGYCFVANQGSRSVAVVSLERFRVMRQIPLDSAPELVLAHPRRPRVLVLAPETGTVYEVDGATYAVSRKSARRQSSCGNAVFPCWRCALGALSRSRGAHRITARYAAPRPPGSPSRAARRLRSRYAPRSESADRGHRHAREPHHRTGIAR